jgi:DNA polymerase-4
MRKIILHIDLNAFFVRCEEIKNPQLEGKAVAIGGEGRAGIVSTASYKAREYGIHSGMPMFQAKMLYKGLIVIPCDFTYYRLMSREFIHRVMRLTRKVEQASIDECYADITEQYYRLGIEDIVGFLKKFQEDLFKETKLKCSIGVGPTKFLAKMGSDYKKPMGITLVRMKDVPHLLFPLSVSSFYGIGKKTYPKLEEIGIKTIGELYHAIKSDDPRIANFFGKYSSDIVASLEGRTSDIVDTGENDPKSVGTTSTLKFDTDDKTILLDVLEREFERIYAEVKVEKKLVKTVQLTFKEARYDEVKGFKSHTFARSLKEPTDDKKTLKRQAREIFYSGYDGAKLRLIGISFQNLIDRSKTTIQLRLDDYQEYSSEDSTHRLIEELNRKIDKDIFFRASELKDKKKAK